MLHLFLQLEYLLDICLNNYICFLRLQLYFFDLCLGDYEILRFVWTLPWENYVKILENYVVILYILRDKGECLKN